MIEVIIEHVRVEEPPATWQTKLAAPADMRGTVRIEQEAAAPVVPAEFETEVLIGHLRGFPAATRRLNQLASLTLSAVSWCDC